MYQRILVPFDGSATSSRGLEEAIRLARLTGGRLRLLHVVDSLSISMGMGMAMNSGAPCPADLFESLCASGAEILREGSAKAVAAGVPVDTVLHDRFDGVVHDVVMAEVAAWKADLIVLGTHGRRGVGRMLLGSGAEKILRVATVPVLLIRASEPSSGAGRAHADSGQRAAATPA